MDSERRTLKGTNDITSEEHPAERHDGKQNPRLNKAPRFIENATKSFFFCSQRKAFGSVASVP